MKHAALALLTLCLAFWAGIAYPQDTLPTKQPQSIILLHGLFQNSYSWEHWKSYFQQQGYQVYAPSYPYHEGPPALLNSQIDQRLAYLTFQEVLDSITSLIDSLPEKPIVIGHSMGGLLVQHLVAAQKVTMGIALAPSNPRGISILHWQYIRYNFRMVNPFRRKDKVCRPPLKWFSYMFFNTLSDSLAKAGHRKYFVPESRAIAKSSTAKGQEIDFSQSHVPMLFITGEKDQDLPSKLIYKNFRAYNDPHSLRAYHLFPGRSHYIAGEPGWEEVAAFIHDWVWSVEVVPRSGDLPFPPQQRSLPVAPVVTFR